MNEFRLDGRVAVITGAGRGIGRAIATTFAEAGATVVAADLDGDAALRAGADLRAEHGGAHEGRAVDVRDPDGVRALADALVVAHGRVDVLVNNAGICRNEPAETMSDASWREVVDVNLNGPFWCARAFGVHMLRRGQGAIVNIASMSGMVVNTPQPQAGYNASKAGVILLTKSLAIEWARRGVRVNAVSPGYIGTEMTQLGMSNEAWRDTWLRMIPTGRLGEPRDVARAALYLASDAAGYATGTNLVVDGGYTSW